MISPEEKDTLSFRVDRESGKYSWEPNNNNKDDDSPKEISKLEKLVNPWASYPRKWNKIFLASSVIGVLIDPLFLYVPVVNEINKCLTADENMKYIALISRTATDLSYFLHLIFRVRYALKMAAELKLSIFTGIPWSHLLIDILAILPIPQIIVLKFFVELAGSRSLITRKIINLLLLLQYIPRLIRVYLSAKELGRGFDSLACRVWVRGAFVFFLYIIFCHIFGALWYFYAIFRETACWRHACENRIGCELAIAFDCRSKNQVMQNVTYLNEFCPIDPLNPMIYDFGIFSNAIESKILQETNFLKKFSRCFWWGLQNLSSLGQNLDTSPNIHENFFAVLISILGLLLFLYLIGTLQLATTNSEEARRKLSTKQPEIESFLSSHNLPRNKKKVIIGFLHRMIKEDKDFDIKCLISLMEEYSGSESFSAWLSRLLDRKTLETSLDLWVSRNGIDKATTRKIKAYVRLRLIDEKEIDVANILHILPIELGKSIKKFLCFPILKKIPMLENMNDFVYETLCNYLKPVTYAEKSYIIRKEEPLDFMLFVTDGIAWNFGSSTNPMQPLEKGNFYGNELLEWLLNSKSYSDFPISDTNLRCHTKVEAFLLRAVDLENVISICWIEFSNSSGGMSEGLKRFAAKSLQRAFRRFIRSKKSKFHSRCLSIVTYK